MTLTPDQLAEHVPSWAIILYFLFDKITDRRRSQRSQGERIGELRRDLDQIASDLDVKLKRRRGGDGG